MAHHRRKHTNKVFHAGDKNTSDWAYPQVERGNRQRSRYGVARWAQRATDSLNQYLAAREARRP